MVHAALAVGLLPLAALAESAQDISGRPETFEQPRVVQGDQREWNGPRVRELVLRAIARRASWLADGHLQDYRAYASGHIYFLYDLGRSTERHLVKADQLALDLYWRTPDLARQVIVGRHEEKTLPTNIRYHLDHLTVVMDNLGDRIHLGEGSEVRDALHPAAAGALEFYEFRLADSLTLVLPDRDVHVYKAEVRPQNPEAAGVVGAIYLDRGTADIVRMELTFTAASYLDDTLDYFNIRLENALWEGKYWLPHRQGIELRRGVNFVNFPAGGIIRAEFRIGAYEFNVGTPPRFFRGPSVASLPAAVREAYEFESGLYDALDPAVAVSPPSLEEIREEATRIIAQSYLQPAQGLQLAVPGISSVIRFRRAEGLYLGPGVARENSNGASVLFLGGYAIAAERWQLFGRLKSPLAGAYDIELTGYLNRVADVSPWKASSGAIATLAALVAGEDYRDPYWSSGGVVEVGRSWGDTRAALSAAWEEWKSASLEADRNIDRAYREVRILDTGEVAWFALDVRRPPVGAVEAVGGATWDVRLEAATRAIAGDFDYAYLALRGELFWPSLAVGTGLRLTGAAGAVAGGKIPAQRLMPLSGRGTVRGYAFHDFVGNLYATLGLEVSRPIWHPFVSVNLFSETGWTGIEGESAREAVDAWNRAGELAGSTRGPLVGVGAGAGLFFDILWVEIAHGLTQGGRRELIVRVRREFWDWL